ncbi:DUF262 domain-containing protein [Butyrivibrio sp. NC2002]|uniref:DUF262 domain-containing protein n=1 Tax=Butyrivibrio sp. NC2002 TaxID=1410610 RepID=UPI0005684FE1|nr:DUF262 domain-containing protein [Butyrivibrio sp. NC2002]
MADIKRMSINELLALNLDIPDYQRPYKWYVQNVEELLSDISNAISDYEKYHGDFRYRIGTVIVYKNKDVFEVVDGQQRIISLTLLKTYLDPHFQCSILNKSFFSKVTQTNIHNNYMFVREWFSLKGDTTRREFKDALDDILEVVMISVDKIAEAFQLFDSQNTRGKELDPHDLLKAYHLREMKEYPYEMEHAVTKWEAKDTTQIRLLFDLYLFPIWNWSRGIKSRPFTAKEIDTYKGIDETKRYTYAKRASKAMPYFQITEPFIAGNDFFEMVDHYINLLRDVVVEIATNPSFAIMKEILGYKSGSAGFGYTKNLFYCAVLTYYDKFHNFDEMAIKKLFTWSFMIRVDMENLGFDSINKYAIGDENNARYTNSIPLFSKISFARLHNEIANLQIKVLRNGDEPGSKRWEWLYLKLKEMNGVSDVSDR